MKFVRKISDRGQITIPAELRELMEIHEGDILEFDLVAVHHPEKKNAPSSPAPAPRQAPAGAEATA